MRLMRYRAAMTAALECFEVGATDEAVEILLAALEDGPAKRPYRCPNCPASFEWPGLLDHHLSFGHWSPPLREAA